LKQEDAPVNLGLRKGPAGVRFAQYGMVEPGTHATAADGEEKAACRVSSEFASWSNKR